MYSAECRHARDVALELVADLVRHEADLLPLHQLPFGIVGAALALGRVARDLGQFLDELGLALLAHAAMTRLAERAVHDQVRDTAGSAT